MSHAKKKCEKHKKRFVLTMRNEKGQVGIFVALIFQVIFVFFAMLVNVGLVVHHKINLQQSTDIAAYYGAMKQAEIMNVMAHVNFQIRQAWKLMAWRYRVLGTFGIEQNNNSSGLPAGQSRIPIQFPVNWPVVSGVNRPMYNPASRGYSCNGAGPNAQGLTVTDIPFMCLGHNGFGDWISAETGTPETYCKVDCRAIQDTQGFQITAIPTVGGAAIHGNALGGAVKAAINQANTILQNVCEKISPITTQMLALYYGNYIKDTQNRRAFIYMLNKNLGLREDQMLDIEGNSILKGVQNTLKNNLTEANLTSMTDTSISTLNGVKSFAGGSSFADAMLKEITFQRLMFFMVDCNYAGGSTIGLKSLYQGGTAEINNDILVDMPKLFTTDPSIIESIKGVFRLNNEQSNTIGYEKNPWIQVYYGVKATAEPKIPFLPLAKIKLHAISFAKPFGGSIGPRYFKDWQVGMEDNKSRTDWENRTDINLPRRTVAGLPPDITLKDSREFFFNYSTHVGDTFSNDSSFKDAANKGGLANTDIVALYHNVLANKYGEKDSVASSDKIKEDMRGRFSKPKRWPKYADWFHLAADVSDAEWDPLALDRQDGTPRNTYMRDIEISVVSPNQFDTTYYSIEPDFFQNYLEKMGGAPMDKLAQAAGLGSKPALPFDYGHKGRTFSTPGIPTNYNVRQQIQVTHDLFKKDANDIVTLNGNSDAAMRFGLDVLASKQSSLLTGWTFLNLSSTGFSTFPGPTTGGGKFSMLFGTCDPALNPWSEDFKAPYDTDKDAFPPVPGNCVTGGRTGYSVKLISSELLRSGMRFDGLGGPNTTGEIKNPVPEEFLQF